MDRSPSWLAKQRGGEALAFRPPLDADVHVLDEVCARNEASRLAWIGGFFRTVERVRSGRDLNVR
jgi:hypothetical protein